ncbi:DUF1491 family protein [Aurantimonas sp. Leaf443]|uniref:DUF1491 family protein n=1 Tax=Aurantimonas sp. Leaf443 TaxID=1736378 RepID=UPI0006F8C886|nr:DUF1491 family protein [Aurantimonas sp. Leaf443]KQT88220.1 hypothetical protein ASG48_01940 [Aurantimonas sp. Leaf443]
MRITSDLYVSQLLRRLFSDGGFAAVERRGAEAAGAIFVVVRGRGGAVQLYGPAVQSMSGEREEGRRFMREAAGDDAALSARFEREARFDPDFWVVEIETDAPERYIEIAEG